MKRIIYIILTSVFLFSGWVNAENTQEGSEHKHEHHHHGKMETSEFSAIPKVSLEATKDSAAGWNLHIITENFTFTPEKLDQDTNEGEGHAHLYVDGEKVARLYGNWYHLSGLTPGPHRIRVSLNNNTHDEFVLNGLPIQAIVEIVEE